MLQDSDIHYFYTKLKAPGENIKHPGEGFRVFVQRTTNSLEQKSLMITEGLWILFKVHNTSIATMIHIKFINIID